MNRSTFLKTLSLSAAAAFCNNPLWKTPSFALPEPMPIIPAIDLPLLPESLCGGVVGRLLNDPKTLEFARDSIVPWEASVTPPVKSLRYHCGLESDLFESGMICQEAEADGLFDNIRYIVEDFIRGRHSVERPMIEYLDSFPVKRRCDGTRIPPYIQVATTLGTRLEINPEWTEATVVYGVPMPIKAKYALQIDIKAVPHAPHVDGHWQPCLGWYARAVMCIARLNPEVIA